MEPSLQSRVGEVLEDDDTILAATREFLNSLSPGIEAICSGIQVPDVSSRLVYRCLTRRAEECLSAVISLVEADQSHMAPMMLRPLCEDLIYGCWLRTLGPEDGAEYINLRAESSVLQSLEAQIDFLPRAYEAFTAWSPSGPDPKSETEGFLYEIPTITKSESQERRKRCLAQLRKLGQRLGWDGRESPSVRQMALGINLQDVYKFFYHGTSKTVHADIHQMLRMVWGNPRVGFNVSGTHMSPYYKLFSLAYGVWLSEQVFNGIVEPEFPKECALIDDEAHSVWLAMVLTGLARNKAFPPLVTKKELE